MTLRIRVSNYFVTLRKIPRCHKKNCSEPIVHQQKSAKNHWFLSVFLLGYPDSNQERQDQNLQCYHYTIPQTETDKVSANRVQRACSLPRCSLTSQSIFSKCAAKVVVFSETTKKKRIFLLKTPKFSVFIALFGLFHVSL